MTTAGALVAVMHDLSGCFGRAADGGATGSPADPVRGDLRPDDALLTPSDA
jgi:hypothetical protein